MKVIKSLENSLILLKGATRKITIQEGGFLKFFRPLMTAGLPLIKNVLKPFAKNVFLLFGLSAWMSVTDAAIYKKMDGSGTTTLILSNEEIRLKNQDYQQKELIKNLKMKQKNKKEDSCQCS